MLSLHILNKKGDTMKLSIKIKITSSENDNNENENERMMKLWGEF